MPLKTAMALVCAVLVLGIPAATMPVVGAAAKPKSNALVYADRAAPDNFVLVEDLRVNDTLTNPEGDRFFMLRTSQGTFELPFETVAEVRFDRFHAMDFLKTATYDVTVTLPQHGVRRGVMELRSLKGTVARNPWYHLLMTRRENAERMHRILFMRDGCIC